MTRRTVLLGFVALLLLGAAACSTTGSLEANTRDIYMAAVEPKGTTTVDKEPFPTTALPAGDGYGLKAPNEKGEWTIETYMWSPGSITVTEGDRVRLHIVGINGAIHPSTISGYDIGFRVKRGEVTTVEFVADKSGIFDIRCDIHQPSMTGTLVVLPR